MIDPINQQIAERVMGWKRVGVLNISEGTYSIGPSHNPERIREFNPTTDPADAMAVLKRCAEKTDQISIVECSGTWAVCEGDGNYKQLTDSEAETLEAAICAFSLKLFP